MATDLARQLQRLKVPGQPSIREAVAKKKPSLLFDGKEAADIDVDTIHALGTNGLEELTALEPSFADFQDSLFSESCKTFERTVQTREVVDQLDSTLARFLRKLSTYLLLKPAHKCLEWLIRAYRVHSCNTDHLMECVLPYYETKLFARIVQLVPLKQQPSWQWLKPTQKEGTPLSRLTLVQHCISNPAFLSVVCEMVPSAVRANKGSLSPGSTRVVTSFYCSTVVAVLQQTSVTESMVSRLLTYILKGLKSSWTDYRAASYIIVSVLASRTTLDVKLTLSLLDVIIKHFGPCLSDEAVSCMVVLSSSTPHIDCLSTKAVRRVVGNDTFVVSLERVSRCCDTSSLVLPLLLSLLDLLCEGDGEQSGRVIQQLLDSVPLSQSTASKVISSLLQWYSNHGDTSDHTVLALVKRIARSLDSKYSCSMDQVLLTAMAVSGEDRASSTINHIQGFVDMALPGTRHKFAADGNASLVLTLHHPDAHVRVGALGSLKTLLAPSSPDGTVAERDREFVSSAILARLRDDDPTVVKAALDLGPQILLSDYIADVIVDTLIDLLSRKRLAKGSVEWQQCVHKAVAVVTSQYGWSQLLLTDKMELITMKLMGLMVLGYHGNDSCGRFTSEIAHSSMGGHHPLLEGLSVVVDSDVWLSACSPANRKSPQLLTDASVAVVTFLGQRLVTMEDQSAAISMVNTMVSYLTPGAAASGNSTGVQDKISRLSMLAVLTVAMTTSSHTLKHHLAQQLLSYVYNYLSCLPLEEKKGHQLVGWEGVTDTPTLAAVLSPLMEKHLKDVITQSHTHLLLWILHSIIQCIPQPENITCAMWLAPPNCCTTNGSSSSSNQLYYSIVLYLFTLLSEWSGNDQHYTAFNAVSRNLMESMMKIHFSDRGSLLRFLAMIWTSPVGGAPHTDCWSCSHTTISEVVQVRALRVCTAYLRAMDPPAIIALVGAQCPIIPSLLLPLGSPVRDLRKGAFRCLAIIHDVAMDQPISTQPFLNLLDTIVTNKLSLVADPRGLQQLLGKLFNGEYEKPLPETPGGRKKSRKRAKQVLMESVLDSVAVHIVGMEAPLHIQYRLLQLLSHVDSKRKLLGVSPLLEHLVGKCSRGVQPSSSSTETEDVTITGSSLTDLEGRTLQQLVRCFTASTAQWLGSEPDLLQLFLSLLPLTTPAASSSPSPAALGLAQITGAFFANISSGDLQQLLLQSVVDLMLYSRGSKVVAMAKDCIANLPLTPDLVTKELLRHQDKLQGAVPATPSKRTRRSTRKQPTQHTSDDVGLPSVHTHVYDNEGDDVGGVLLPWRRVSLVLEVVQNKCGEMQDGHQLVPHLFSLLSWCLEVDDKVMSSFEYIQQLILTSLLNICTTWGLQNTHAITAAHFNVELIVKCVRISTNPHTHQTALLLLSSAATVFPTHILHNVMPIFTFMGASLLRRDDQYSLHVIKKTVDIIIPALIKSGSSMKRSSTLLSAVTDIVRVFVDAAPHVPPHRRLPLFSHLLSTVGPQDYLYVALGLLVEKHVVLPTGKELTSDEAHFDGKFMATLSREYTALVQLWSCLRLVEYVRGLPEDKPENTRKARQLPASVTLLFNISLHSQKQLRQFKYTIVSLVNAIVSGLSYTDIQRDMEEGGDKREQLLLSIFQEALYYTVSLSQSQTHSNDEASNRFWQAMLKKTCDTIDGVSSLLSLDSFLTIVHQLLIETEGYTLRGGGRSGGCGFN